MTNSPKLAEALYQPVYQLITSVVEGSARDVQSYSRQLTEFLAEAVATNDQEALASLGRTATVLAEKQRVTARNMSAATFGGVLQTIGAVAATAVDALAQGAVSAVAKALPTPAAPPSIVPTPGTVPPPPGTVPPPSVGDQP